MIYQFIQKNNITNNTPDILIQAITKNSNLIKVNNIFYVVHKDTVLLSIDINNLRVYVYTFIINNSILDTLNTLDLIKNCLDATYSVQRIGTRNVIEDLEFTGRYLTNIQTLPTFITKVMNTNFPLLNDLMEINK